MRKKIYFETYGCALNQADSETMKGLLEQDGYVFSKTPTSANLIIINSCIVKSPTLSKILSRAKQYKKQGKKVLITGCISQAEPDLLHDFSILGTEQLGNISYAVQETLLGNMVHYIGRTNEKRLGLPKHRKNNIIEIVPISKGCLGTCTYCKVRFARGTLVSYPLKDIVAEVTRAIKTGAKEIWLTSQDNGCYGHDIGTNVVQLLDAILALPGDFKVRLGMANPNFIKRYLSDFLRLFEHDKLYRFLHIPVQAGSDSVLKHMKRKYTANDFKIIVQKLRMKFLDITIATDIICGYPTETDTDFFQTLELLEQTQPDVINISKFYPMPGTEASKLLHKYDTKIAAERSKQATKLHKTISKKRNEAWVGWEDVILIDDKGKSNTWVGRNYVYKPVVVSGRFKLGDTLNVKITKASTFYLFAEKITKKSNSK